MSTIENKVLSYIKRTFRAASYAVTRYGMAEAEIHPVSASRPKSALTKLRRNISAHDERPWADVVR